MELVDMAILNKLEIVELPAHKVIGCKIETEVFFQVI